MILLINNKSVVYATNWTSNSRVKACAAAAFKNGAAAEFGDLPLCPSPPCAAAVSAAEPNAA